MISGIGRRRESLSSPPGCGPHTCAQERSKPKKCNALLSPCGALANRLPVLLAKPKIWSRTSDLRIRAVGALSECFFRLKDIYQPQGGESRPRLSARAHVVGSRVDCLGPRFGPRAVEPPERNKRFHFGSEGLGVYPSYPPRTGSRSGPKSLEAEPHFSAAEDRPQL